MPCLRKTQKFGLGFGFFRVFEHSNPKTKALLKHRPLMIPLEGFLVILMIGLTKNPSRRIINGLGVSRKIGPKYKM